MPPLVDFNNSRDTLPSSDCYAAFKGFFNANGEPKWEINRSGYLSATETFVMQMDF